MQIVEWSNSCGYDITLSPSEAKEILNHLYNLNTQFTIVDDYKEYEFLIKGE